MLDLLQNVFELIASMGVSALIVVFTLALLAGFFSKESENHTRQGRKEKQAVRKMRERGQFENMSEADHAIAHHGFVMNKDGVLINQHRPSESQS